MTGFRQTFLFTCVVVLGGCAGAGHTSRASAPLPDGWLPDDHTIEVAPPCVFAMGQTRKCFAEHLTSQRGSFSCPTPPAWHRPTLRMGGRTDALPSDLHYLWDTPVHCGISFSKPLTQDQRQLLEAMTVKLADYGKIDKLAYGSVELSHLYCVAEFDFVSQLDCARQSPVLQ